MILIARDFRKFSDLPIIFQANAGMPAKINGELTYPEAAVFYMSTLIPTETIEKKIILVRGYKVILDRDLAQLYGVETRVLKQAVRRNIKRFPEDFMFVLSKEEFHHWRSQFVTSDSPDKMGLRYPPMAFTEQGVAMLSSVLNSEQAVQVNILIMRTFVRLREMIASHRELAGKLEELEKKYDDQFKVVFDAIRQLMIPPDKPKRQIGFQAPPKRRRKT